MMINDRVVFIAMLIGSIVFAAPGIAESPGPVVVGNAESTPKQPQATIDFEGTIHLVFGDGEWVKYCQSRDGGKSFSPPIEAFRVRNMSLGMRRGPRIAVSNGHIVVTAIGGPIGKGRDGDLQAWNSSDAGRTWKGPFVVNDEPNSAREGLHAMCSTSDGSVWNVWLDLRHKRTEIYASQSTDQGIRWTSNRLLYQNPEKSVCECCHPSVVARNDTIAVMFRNSLRGNRDMFLLTSEDSGKTFSKARKLGEGEWQINGCPMDGGMLAIGANSQIDTAWTRKGMIYGCDAHGQREEEIGNGNQPWVAASAHGPIIVWTNSSERVLLVKRPQDKSPIRIETAATDPIVVSNPLVPDRALILWETKVDGNNAIYSFPIASSKGSE